MLFADIVGYSKLPPADVPLYVYRFLAMVADRIGDAPRFVNTWGDAVFAVMDEAVPMVKYAMAFQEVVCDTDWTREGFSGELNVRIALHAGPVFSGVDPITCRQNFYGSQVNRAARIEPVTVPGHIYASEQFVAMLVVEEASADQDPVAPRDWACEWLGTLALAKEFGPQTIYHIRRGRC
jgi:class 3 adenylate cyclase